MSSNISFAQNLQSEGGHRAIMWRLESELKILEVLKKYLTCQVKLDKEHSQGIGNAAISTMKVINSILGSGESSSTSSNGDLNNGGGRLKKVTPNASSVISVETIHVLQEIEKNTESVKRNVHFLEENTLTELNELISQKKILLKSAQEEYGKIRGNLDQFAELIKKQRVEYFKQFNSYEASRTKFEENCSKGDNLKKSDDLRDKFFRMKGRLNLSHTVYLLAIQEAKIFDRDFRTILLPSLLQIEQNWCERQLKQWGQILDDILSHSPSITIEARFKLKEFEFGNEFGQLIQQNKTPPLPPMDFKFEPARISSQPVAQSTLIVDSSTTTFLRKKITELEKSLLSAETQLKEKQTDKNKYKGDDLVEDLKSFDILVSKCDTDRFKSLKSFLAVHFSGTSVPGKLDAISLIGEQSLRKPKVNRFATFLRQTATLTRKSTSYDGGTAESPRATHSSAKGSLTNGTLCGKKDLVQGVADEQWFHGVLPREDVIRLLKQEGDYLVRETTKNAEQQLVLSVLSKGHKHFMVQTTTNGQFQFEGPIFKTVKELVTHYVTKKLPITSRSGALIVTAVNREKWELNNDDVQLIEKIGKGNFGDVYKAVVNGTVVAVKTCKSDLPEDQKRKFLREARILKQYNHPNIVQFIGICAQKQPIMIAMELVPGGSLLTYLKGKAKSLRVKTLAEMTVDTAAGMKYLEQRNCLHRDLAARNCLIDETTSSVKISDFGMSREEHEYTVSDGLKQIPIKWTAPEALNYGKYTTLSDCWSFGILMWEIFSRGSTPYPGMSNSKAREMIEAGYRMPPPDGIPDVIYQLMTRCWQYEPEQRPRFSEIHLELEVISKSDLI